jgi:hypothetical protein
MNALLGWWSIGSIFFYGWRSLLINFRAVWATPGSPGNWGAISASDFLDFLFQGSADREATLDDQTVRDSPLRFLTRSQMELVVSAEGLYETIGVPPSAGSDELRSAYHQRCKEAHPDIQSGSPTATAEMVRLNAAWEILRSQQMRDAYDWLQTQSRAAR